MAEELVLVDEDINIEDMIYEIRGKQVMLDSDLAKLFHVETGSLNRQVKRNIDRFPKDFMFQLTEEENKTLICQIGIPKKEDNRGGRRTMPFVFTEHGISMLATVLHTEIAIKVSIKIIRAFVNMRKFISNSFFETNSIYNMLINHDNKINYIDNEIKLLNESFNKLEEKELTNKIFFDGQIYDAHSFFLNILSKSKEEIIIIDNYAGKELLDILKDINKNIIIISSNINNTLIKKYNKQYNKQYNNIIFKYNTSFHDRFILIDKKELYSCGASFKDLGKKCFSINKIEDMEYINIILSKID